MAEGSERLIAPEEFFAGQRVGLRLVTLADCTPAYVAWLEDSDVNRYLETRWSPQSMESVRQFVTAMLGGSANYLFAIVETDSGRHVGNLKIGPINAHHGFADVSYFIGEKSCWGRGYASEALLIAKGIAFERLGLRRLQAGLYEGNVGSARALEKAGFSYEARFQAQLRGPAGLEDHVWYACSSDER